MNLMNNGDGGSSLGLLLFSLIMVSKCVYMQKRDSIVDCVLESIGLCKMCFKSWMCLLPPMI